MSDLLCAGALMAMILLPCLSAMNAIGSGNKNNDEKLVRPTRR